MCQKKRDFLERAGYKNRHHDKAKSRGGSYSSQNIIMLDERRHAALHLCFGLRSMLEIAQVCIRMHNIKNKTDFFIDNKKCDGLC